MNSHPNATHKKSVSPLAAGIVGLAVGAAGAAAIALSDKQTRDKASEKAQKVSTDLKNWGQDKINDLQMKKSEGQKEMNKSVSETKKQIIEKVEKKLEDLK